MTSAGVGAHHPTGDVNQGPWVVPDARWAESAGRSRQKRMFWVPEEGTHCLGAPARPIRLVQGAGVASERPCPPLAFVARFAKQERVRLTRENGTSLHARRRTAQRSPCSYCGVMRNARAMPVGELADLPDLCSAYLMLIFIT